MIDSIDFDCLADKEGSDKGASGHAYGASYSAFLSNRTKPIETIVELGVGGGSFRGVCGGSLRLWKGLFPEAKIIGVDSDRSCLNCQEERIEIIIGEQDDMSISDKILSASSGQAVDLLVDDASHVPENTVKSFFNLFPILSAGGIYVIEDTHCSYEEEFGNQRAVFEGFLFRIISTIDLGGRKVSDHNFQDFEKVAEVESLDFWEKSIESIFIRRGIVAVQRR